jgi:hypothetical protein
MTIHFFHLRVKPRWHEKSDVIVPFGVQKAARNERFSGGNWSRSCGRFLPVFTREAPRSGVPRVCVGFVIYIFSINHSLPLISPDSEAE